MPQPDDDAAPRLGEDNGAGATVTVESTDCNAPLPMGRRPLPGDFLTCHTLAALIHKSARDRMHDLGIGPEAFEYTEERTIASALMAERDFTSEERLLLDRDDGQHIPWRLAIRWHLDPVWAVEVVDRFAAARARWWFPLWLMGIRQGIALGRPLSWAVQELVLVLQHVRPVANAVGRP